MSYAKYFLLVLISFSLIVGSGCFTEDEAGEEQLPLVIVEKIALEVGQDPKDSSRWIADIYGVVENVTAKESPPVSIDVHLIGENGNIRFVDTFNLGPLEPLGGKPIIARQVSFSEKPVDWTYTINYGQ